MLTGGLVVQAGGLLGIAALLTVDAPSLAVYASAVIASVAVVTARPTIAALLVEEVEDPHELTAANAVIGWFEGLASFVGPAITAVGFAVVGTEAPFLVFGLLTLGAACVAAGLRPVAHLVDVVGGREADDDVVDEDPPPSSGWSDIAPLLGVLAGNAFVVGALDLLFVVVAIDITGGSAARAGWLSSMFGIGAIVGAASSMLLIGCARIWPAVLVAGAVTATALGLVGASTAPGFAALALAGCGFGTAAVSVSARTLLQRVSDLRLLCRAFSLAEAFEMAMLLVGTVAVPLLVSLLGARQAPVGVALVAVVVLLLASPPMASSEGRFAAPLERLAALQADELFAFLDAPALETLARQAVPRSVPAGATVVTQGDPGDDYFVIVSGRVSVSIDGRDVGDLGPGDGFGELALVHDIPRTATVVATEHTALLAIDRRTFLIAVSGSPTAATRTYPNLPETLGPAA